MIRIRFAAIIAALLLAGCAASPSREVFPRHYELTGDAVPQAQHRVAAAHWSIRIDAVGAPGWLDGTRMHYRLGYRDDHQVAAYAGSDWLAPPARMLGAMVRRSLAESGDWRVVVGPGDPARTDFVLRLRLDGFGQLFTSPTQSYGVLDATATLTAGGGEDALAQRRFALRTPAPAADAAGGVAALNDASARFATELQAWLRSAVFTAPVRRDQVRP